MLSGLTPDNLFGDADAVKRPTPPSLTLEGDEETGCRQA